MRQLELASSPLRSELWARRISLSGAVLCIVGLYAVLVYASIERGPRGIEACNRDFWAGCDEISHIQQINFFIAHPTSLLHYPATTATTPGFYALVAWLARISGVAEVTADTWLRVVPLGLGVLVMLWWTCRALGSDAWRAALLCLPILTSNISCSRQHTC